MSSIVLRRIGVIRSPFSDVRDMPIQPQGAQGVKGSVTVDPEFQEGLKDLEGFSHIFLLYHFHLTKGYALSVVPFLDDAERGVFATRAPKRPNPIGLSIVRLTGISGNTLFVEDVDIADGTPLIDIKPFVPYFDNRENASAGWLTGKMDEISAKRSDTRFTTLPGDR